MLGEIEMKKELPKIKITTSGEPTPENLKKLADYLVQVVQQQ